MHAKSILCLLLLCTGGSVLDAAVVSWVGNNGDWNTPSNWSTGTLPGPGDDVVIDRPGEILITHSIGSHTVNSVQCQEAFTLSGGSLTVSNTLEVNRDFTLSGGTLARATIVQANSAQTIVTSSGTFDGVTMNGELDVGRRHHGAMLTVSNGLVLNGTLYVGNPTNTSSYGSVHLSGSQTLSGNGTVVFGARSDGCNVLRLVNGGTTLTIAAGIIIRGHSGSVGYSPCWGGPLGALANHGTILSGTGGTIFLYAQRLTNAGTLMASNNSALFVETLQNTASGTLSINDATLGLGGTWTNGGTINVSNATVNLGGNFTPADLGVFNRVGGTVNLTGTLDAGGGTLPLNAATGSWTMNGGTLRNAVVTTVGGVHLIFGTGTFDGVTVNGDLDVGRRNHGAMLTVANGLVLNGTLYVGNPTNASMYGSVHFSGSQSLSGNGTVVFGIRGDACNTLRLINGGTTLTIGSGITVRGHSGSVGYSPCWSGASGAVLNQGTILAEVSGGTISLHGQRFTNEATVTVSSNASLYIDTLHNLGSGTISVSGGTLGLGGNWTNGGTINVSNSTVNLGGTFTLNELGVLNRTGGIVNLTGTFNGANLALDATTGSWVMNGGTLRNTAVSASGGADVILGTGTFDGVTVNGDLDVGRRNHGAMLTVVNGLVLNGTLYVGNPTNTSMYGSVHFSGSQSLSGNGTVLFGIRGDACNTLRLVNAGTTLTIAPGITVRGHSGSVGYSPCWSGASGAVLNQGTILAEVSGGTISLHGQRFTNEATVTVSSNASLYIDTLHNLGSGTISVSGGTLGLGGTWMNAGTINVSNSTVNLGGTFTLNELGVLNRTGGIVHLTGTFNGANLALDGTTGSWTVTGGTLRNTVVITSDGAELILGTGTFDGVTINGDLDVGRRSHGALLTVINGLVLNGTLYVGNPMSTPSMYGSVHFSGSQSLSGSGTVVFGVRGDTCNTLRLVNPGTTLTIGAGITVRGHSGSVGYSPCWGGPLNVAVVNQGTILSEGSGGAISLYGQRVTNEATLLARNSVLVIDTLHNTASGTVTVVNDGSLRLGGSWTNGGTITASNATVDLGGTFALDSLGVFNRVGGTVNLTGTLDAGGGTLALDATTGPWTINGGTLRNAMLMTADGAQLIVDSGTFDGVTAEDFDVGVSRSAVLTMLNGLVLNGTMRVGNPTNNSYGTVNFLGTQTLSGGGAVVFGNNSSMYNGLRVVNNNTALTIGPGITVRGHRGRIGYNPGWGGNLAISVTNLGTISADVAGGQIDILGQRFDNMGLLETRNGGTLAAGAQTTINNGEIELLTGGIVDFNGSLHFNTLTPLLVPTGCVLRVSGSLSSDSSNLADFVPSGTISLDGSGTVVAPQLLEVMGRDVGSVPQGFTSNFVYGALTLANNTYVRLVDFSDNLSGASAEAIYVNSLVVPAGSTLNLNGLNLYARTAQVAGVVINTASTSFATDFTTHPGAQGIQFRTTPLNSPNAGYWDSSGGYVVLTDAVNNQRGKMLLPVLSDTERVGAFSATMKVRLGGSTCCVRGGMPSPADGFSFNFAALNDPAVTAADGLGWIEHNPEEGVTNGISVCLDTWDNAPGEGPNIDLKVDGRVVATAEFAGLYRYGGQPVDPVRDGMGNQLDLRTGADWAELSVSLNQCGGVTVIYKGVTIFNNVASGYVPRIGRFILGARTGGANDNHHVDDINITVESAGSSSLVSGLIPTVSRDVSVNSPVGFLIQERLAINTNSIQLRLDGSVVPAVVTSQTNSGVVTYTVQHTPSAPFAAASTHIVELTFSHIDSSSCTARRSFTTSIIGAGALFIEAEDFNYSDADGVNPGQHIEFGAPDGSLVGRDATIGIDVQDDVSLNGATGVYRTPSGVEAAKGPGPNTEGDQSRLRGSRLITADWIVGWTIAGEWLNYTRTFPDAKYNAYVRWSSGAAFETPMAAELAEVISNPAQSNQVVRKIGEFRNPESTGGWSLYFGYSPLRDTNGSPLAVRLYGKRTLRFTVLPGAFDYNYLVFVPDPAASILRPIVGVTPPNGTTTSNAYPRIDVLFTNRDAAVVTSTLRLMVNGVDVTSSSIISNTAFGGIMSYQVPQPGYPVLSTVNVSASFTDDGPVPETQTIDWSFTAGGILITDQPADQTTPLGGDATFSVSAIGPPPLGYEWRFNNAAIAGATNSTFTVTNAQAADVGDYKVVVSNPGGAVTSAVAILTVIFPPPMVEITPPSTNVALGGMVTFCADVTGHGPFTYQWRQNGVTLTNETNVCLHISDVQLSHGGSYSVIVANNGGATLSDPALLVLDVRVVQGSDSVTNRRRLTNDSGVGSGTNSFATSDPGEPRHFGKPGGKSIWYEWRPSTSGIARFETVGSTFDTLIAVYVQCSSNELVEVASDDDSGPNLTSIVQFNAIAGTTYLIAVDGFGGADGVYALSWNLAVSPNPLPIIVQPPQSLTVAPGDAARFEVQAVAGATITSHCDEPGTNSTAGLSYQWFRNGTLLPDATSAVFTIPSVGEADLGSYLVEVIQGSQTNRTPPASLQLNLTGEQPQNVQAQNKFEDAAETQGIELGDEPPVPLARRPKVPAGGGTVVRGYSGTQVFNTSGSTTEPGDEPICGVIGGASQWITFVCRETGALYLNTDGSSYNTVMAVFVRKRTNPAALEMVDCDNNGGGDGRDSALTVPVEGGETNFVMVDGVNGQTGTLVLNYSLVTPCLVTAPTINGDGNFQLRIAGRTGMKLTVQRSTDMINWTDLSTLTLPTPTFDYVDPSGAGTGQKFYRALMLP